MQTTHTHPVSLTWFSGRRVVTIVYSLRMFDKRTFYALKGGAEYNKKRHSSRAVLLVLTRQRPYGRLTHSFQWKRNFRSYIRIDRPNTLRIWNADHLHSTSAGLRVHVIASSPATRTNAFHHEVSEAHMAVLLIKFQCLVLVKSSLCTIPCCLAYYTWL